MESETKSSTCPSLPAGLLELNPELLCWMLNGKQQVCLPAAFEWPGASGLLRGNKFNALIVNWANVLMTLTNVFSQAEIQQMHPHSMQEIPSVWSESSIFDLLTVWWIMEIQTT